MIYIYISILYIYILNIYHLFGDHCNVDEDLSGDNMLLVLWFLPILGLQLEFNKKYGLNQQK
jgi:hypothetical protein